jgi:protein gp37
MGESSNIQWTDDTWNPWRGCTKVGPGCLNCYAEVLTMNRMGGGRYAKGVPRVRHRPATFNAPLKWNKKSLVCDNCHQSFAEPCHHDTDNFCCIRCPNIATGYHRRRVFSLSLGDWLDDEVPISWLADMLDVIRRCPNLTFQLLTKRPELWNRRVTTALGCMAMKVDFIGDKEHWVARWLNGEAPDNIWLGCSVENQATADERIPKLLQIPAKVRFVSFEPALEAVDFCKAFGCICGGLTAARNGLPRTDIVCGLCDERQKPLISWVIVGGESGPHARPFDIRWAQSTIAQCKAAGVEALFKQGGSNCWLDGRRLELKDSHGGDLSELPTDLNIRRFPALQRK